MRRAQPSGGFAYVDEHSEGVREYNALGQIALQLQIIRRNRASRPYNSRSYYYKVSHAIVQSPEAGRTFWAQKLSETPSGTRNDFARFDWTNSPCPWATSPNNLILSNGRDDTLIELPAFSPRHRHVSPPLQRTPAPFRSVPQTSARGAKPQARRGHAGRR